MTTSPANSSETNLTAPALKYDPAYLGDPPLVPGEDAKGYDRLLALVADVVDPRDIMEVIWIRDFVDEEWGVLRYRRAMASLINAAKVKALTEALCQLEDYAFDSPGRKAEQLARKWAKGDQAAIEKVNTLLDSSECTEEALIAQALSLKLDDIACLERMILIKEARRDNVLREIDLHRASLTVQLRRISADLKAGGYDVIEDEPVEAQRGL
jgi:hypothetical protein